MPYTKINWQDLPSTSTPLDATNLNKMDSELEKLSCKEITQTGEDLNDYKTRGLYWFGSTNPSNRPANIAGWLEVIEYNNRYVRQIWHRSSSINGTAEFETYIRFTNDYGANWSTWKKITMGEVFDNAIQEIPTGANLNNYTTPGTYRCPNGTTSQSLSNCPAGNVGFKLVVECTSGGERYRQTIYANRLSGDLTYIRHNNGSWGNWYTVTMTQA